MLLPDRPLLSAYLAASLILALSPGPVVLYVVARGLAQGRLAGLVSAAGAALGNLGNILAATLGLAALLTLWPIAFDGIRYLGAAYLVYLGLRQLHVAPAAGPCPAPAPEALGRLFRDGMLVSLLNPKTTLFFAAFLPQFMRPGADHLAQSISLGLLFVGIALLTDSLYALAAGSVAGMLQRNPSCAAAGRYLVAGLLIGLGLYAALASQVSAA
jgi:threonine/homoserine/homoserine lactone efflux protein